MLCASGKASRGSVDHREGGTYHAGPGSFGTLADPRGSRILLEWVALGRWRYACRSRTPLRGPRRKFGGGADLPRLLASEGMWRRLVSIASMPGNIYGLRNPQGETANTLTLQERHSTIGARVQTSNLVR